MHTTHDNHYALGAEISAYNAIKESLQKTHSGKWVVFYGAQLQGAYEDFDSAASAAVRKFGRGPYLIREVGEEDITLPTSVVYAISQNAF